MKVIAGDRTLTHRMASQNKDSQNTNEESKSETATDKFIRYSKAGGAAAGGTLAGLFLGGVGSKLVANTTGLEVVSKYGAPIGAVIGLGAALGAQTDNKVLKKSMYAQAAATAGMTAGLYGGGFVGNLVANAGAAGHFATNGTLIGATALAVAGASAGFGTDTEFGDKLRDFSNASLGGTTGYFLGGGAQALAETFFPSLGTVMTAAPALYATTGALVGAAKSIDSHPGYDDQGNELERTGYQKFGQFVETGASFGVGASVGFTAGAGVGALVDALTEKLPGLAQHYGTTSPILGAATGGMISAAIETGNENWGKAAALTGSTGVGLALGDLAGYGLTKLTGMPIYAAIGSAAGAATGASLAAYGIGEATDDDTIIGKAGKYAAPITAGVTVGSSAGALVGALLSHFLENGTYQIVGSGLGTASGAMIGLYLALARAKAESENDQ